MIDSGVYFMMPEDGGPIRIGCTGNAASNRLKVIQSTCHEKLAILAMIPGYRVRESMLHIKFRDNRLHGEWFRPTAALWRIIEEAQLTGDVAALPEEPDRYSKIVDIFPRLRAIGLCDISIAKMLSLTNWKSVRAWRAYTVAPPKADALFLGITSGFLSFDGIHAGAPALVTSGSTGQPDKAEVA